MVDVQIDTRVAQGSAAAVSGDLLFADFNRLEHKHL